MTLHFTSGTNTAANASAYQVTGGEWTSGTIQWSNKPAADVLLQSNISHNNVTGYVFSCLTAVQHWYDGDTTGQNENYGIMLRYYNESTADYNAVYSADYSDATKRPSLTIYYQPVTNEVGMLVGQTRTLTAPDYAGTITWTSSDTSVATVSSSGVVTSVKVGATTVTAYGGGNELKKFNVYVKIQDGVYYIKNTAGSYLGTSGQCSNGTKTYLYTKATSGRALLNQLWRIDYLGQGNYSIRPLYNMNMALCSEGGVPGSVVITTIGTGVVPGANRWSICSSTTGFELYCAGTSYMTLCCEQSYPGSAVVTKNGSVNPSGRYWLLESAPSVSPQLLLMDAQTGASVVGTKKYIDPGQTVTLEDLGITAAFVYLYSTNQDVVLLAPGSTVVSTDSIDDTIKGLTPGAEATITVRHILNGTSYDATFIISVKPIIDGTYYLRSQIYNRYLQIDNDDASNNYATSGAIMEQWEYDGSEYQKWALQWRGDGYYSIISAKSGKALTVPSGQAESANVTLVQQPYTGSDRQLWKITITDDHYYKIKAKSSEGASDDLVMAVGDRLINDSNGVNIEQRVYLNRDDKYYNHLDKWFICSFVDIGMSTDNYTGAPNERERQAYLYATTFWDGINDGNPFNCVHNYNKDSVYMASKTDFAQNGAMSNDTDFMIYIGHGHSAGKCANNEKGNHIQYCHAAGGEVVKADGCELNLDNIDDFCLYTDDVRFGSSDSDLRWVWMYTCYFLNINENATEDELKKMMTGAHILMGYGTQSKLCKPNVELFAKHLRNGETIIDSFFWAGQFGEATCTTDNHLQRVMYIPQAEFETIYSPQIHYDYEPEDVQIDQRGIQDQNAW